MVAVLICHHLIGTELNTNEIKEAGLYELIPASKPSYTIKKIGEYDDCILGDWHKEWGKKFRNREEQ